MSKRGPTIKDIASVAGVSVATVSRFINQSGYVNDSTADLIRSAIEETGYVPSMLARGLKTRRTGMFLLIVPDIANPFYSRIARKLQHLAQENGFAIMLFDSEAEQSRELEALMLARQMSADGVFFATIDSNPRAMQLLEETEYRTVGLNAFEEGMPFDTVVVHHLGGTNLAVDHLIALGHRHIVFAGGTPGTLIGKSRLKGYVYAMDQHGMPCQENAIFQSSFNQAGGYEAGRRILALDPLPTAICCANDLVALGVIRALNDAGLRVPQDISVTGMDDIPYADLSSPPLTTVENDGEYFAERAFNMMLRRLNGERSAPVRQEIPNALCVRGSSAEPRASLGSFVR
ncbi:MAG: LacI family DNA-binding transcriptional regulator [Clostridia bacterium]|nr:LacI family DNA-binding transcriptional regulator [Clostridia bacterium]MBQ8973693.1 LacI family DNA-binding transcriptional regulator [Clostridia bacterium]